MKKRMNLKRMVSVLLTLLILIGIMTMGVADVSAIGAMTNVKSKDGEWLYGYNPYMLDGFYYVEKYVGTKTKITLPEEIDGNTITAVDMSYTQDSAGTLKYITVPKSYVYIDFSDTSVVSVTCSREHEVPAMYLSPFGSFNRCKQLKKVVLPNLIADTCNYPLSGQVGYLQANTFQNCTKLEEVVLPDNTLIIGVKCFSNCKSLKSLTVPDGCKRIETYAIDECTSMTTLILPGTIEYMSPIDASDYCTFVCPSDSYAYKEIQKKAQEYKNLGLDISYTMINSNPVDLLGDANGDGKLNINDATLIQRHLADLLIYNISNGDADDNGKININDVTYLQRKLAKLID